MQGHPSLRELVWRNGDDHSREKHICLRTLFSTRTVPCLNIWYCNVADDGAAVIADVLAETPSSLVTLNLCENKIGAVGGKAISGVLHKVTRSRALTLMTKLCSSR